MSLFSEHFFIDNRRKLAAKMQGGVVVLAGNRLMQRRGDTTYPFDQDANFWYLAGVSQPQLVLVYDGQRDYSWLVKPTLSDVEQIFDGTLDDNSLQQASGVNEVIAESQLEDTLRQLARRHSTAYTVMPTSGAAASRTVYNPAGRELTQRLERIFNSVQDCSSQLAELRSIKRRKLRRLSELLI